MNYTLAVYETAKQDIADAFNWYEKQKAGLGDEFLLEFSECCKRIFNFPLGCQIKHKHFRQAGIKRFPFVVVYEVINKEIIVYSVFHTSRNPEKKYGKK